MSHVIAVISDTEARAGQIAAYLGIETPHLFGAGMASEFEGLRADRVLIDGASVIDGDYAKVTRATALKAPGSVISFVTVRNVWHSERDR